MNKELNIQQLVSYVTGNCSKNDQKLVEQWLDMSDDNMMLFDEFKQVWDYTSVKNDSCLIDIEKRWNDFKDRANFNETISVEVAEKSTSFSIKGILYNAARIAAVLIVVFGLYLLFEKGNQADIRSFTATVAQLSNPFVLPDGSDITMNRGAQVEYPEYFSSDIREVNFKGEAFFEIAHNPDIPMIIATDNVRVKVLGTSFNLCNCVGSDEITVYLETGKVLFYSIDIDDGSVLEQIILLPGDKGIYNKNTGLITKHQFTDNNHIAWKTGVLEFVNAPLPDVIKVIEKTYNIKVNSSIILSDNMLTARFDNETPESIFESLQIIFGLDYEIDNNSVVIN